MRSVTVAPRFCGLPDVAHGGYVAGVLAGAVGGTSAEVRLRRPAPIGRALRLEPADDEVVELRDGNAVVAEGVRSELSLDVPLPPTPAEATAAAQRQLGSGGHLFPHCFGCGPERTAGDGLRIFPGPVAGRRLVAAPWLPPAALADGAGHVPGELVWAALDCPQLWALILHAGAAASTRVVTGALAARLERPVVTGEPHVVMAWPLGRDGRGWIAGAAVIGPDGELCASGRQTAVSASWGVPLGGAHWRRSKTQHDRRSQT